MHTKEKKNDWRNQKSTTTHSAIVAKKGITKLAPLQDRPYALYYTGNVQKSVLRQHGTWTFSTSTQRHQG